MGGETEVLARVVGLALLTACWKLKAGFRPAQPVGPRNWTKACFSRDASVSRAAETSQTHDSN